MEPARDGDAAAVQEADDCLAALLRVVVLRVGDVRRRSGRDVDRCVSLDAVARLESEKTTSPAGTWRAERLDETGLRRKRSGRPARGRRSPRARPGRRARAPPPRSRSEARAGRSCERSRRRRAQPPLRRAPPRRASPARPAPGSRRTPRDRRAVEAPRRRTRPGSLRAGNGPARRRRLRPRTGWG